MLTPPEQTYDTYNIFRISVGAATRNQGTTLQSQDLVESASIG